MLRPKWLVIWADPPAKPTGGPVPLSDGLTKRCER